MLVIANEEAGSAERTAVAAAVTILSNAEPVDVAYTSDQVRLNKILDERRGRRLVVAGGDGSLHALVAALHSRGELRQCPLGLIPLGTGNDLARGLGIPLDPEGAAQVILSGEQRRLDLLVDDAGGIVLNAVHLGIGARATQVATPLKPRLGRFAFPVGALVAGLGTRGWRIDVHIDGRRVADARSPVLMVTLSNGPTLGGGFAQPQPAAVPDDGLIDVVVSQALGPLARVGFAVGLGRGTHLTRRDSQVARGRQVTVAGEPFLTVADGEIDGPTTERTWTLEPAAWQLSRPRPANPPLRQDSQEAAES